MEWYLTYKKENCTWFHLIPNDCTKFGRHVGILDHDFMYIILNMKNVTFTFPKHNSFWHRQLLTWLPNSSLPWGGPAEQASVVPVIIFLGGCNDLHCVLPTLFSIFCYSVSVIYVKLFLRLLFSCSNI